MPKLPEQPYCRMCGKPIAKRTTLHFIRMATEQSMNGGDFWKDLYLPEDQRPIDRAGCQRLVNEQVISVRYRHPREGTRVVVSFNTWDGESYVDEFFCNGSCARDFAYMMAHSYPNAVHRSYNEAAAKRAAAAAEQDA